MKAEKTKQNITLNVVVAALLILLIGFVAWWFINAKSNTTDDNSTNPLDISIVRDGNGITLSNNEPKALTGCKLTLNEEYSTNVETIDGQSRTYSYDDFTKEDGTKFSALTTQAKSLNVNECDEEPSRFSAYTW